jgi:arylsulfatase
MKDAKAANKPFSAERDAHAHLDPARPESQGKTGLACTLTAWPSTRQVGEILKALDIWPRRRHDRQDRQRRAKFTCPTAASPRSAARRTPTGRRLPRAPRSAFRPKRAPLNDIFGHEDMLPTLVAAAGDPNVKEKLLKGMSVGGRTFKNHIDGYDIRDALAGKAPGPRKEFFYFNDDGSLVALRFLQWKFVFAEQRAHGMDVWQDPFVPLRLPKLFNLRSDPFETADKEGMDYSRWRAEHVFLLMPAQSYVAQFLATFKEYPPRQKPGSFSIDKVLEQLSSGVAGRTEPGGS